METDKLVGVVVIMI